MTESGATCAGERLLPKDLDTSLPSPASFHCPGPSFSKVCAMKVWTAGLRWAWHYRKQSRLGLDRVVVLDLEATTAADRPPNAIRDVIELGVCELNLSDGSARRAASVIVRPSSSEVTAFATKLTGITAERAAKGVPFVDAIGWLVEEYQPASLPWAAYGNFDRAQLISQCEREGLEFPLNPDYLNIKLLAALRFGWARQKGLSSTLDALALKPEGRAHRGRDDAVNAACVLYRALQPALRADGCQFNASD